MIEFKADCGHVIQAPDQDAGKIVKCAYCGREVEAPLRDEEDPDLLFQEVDLNELAKSESLAGVSVAMTIQGHQKRARSAPSAEDIAQTGNRVLRISLVAAFSTICLVVLVFGIRAMVSNMTSPERPPSDGFGSPVAGVTPPQTPSRDLQPKAVDTPTTSVRDAAPTEPIAVGSGGRVDYSFASSSQGVFIEVFNKAARIYIRDRESTSQEILGTDESEREGLGTLEIPLPPGQYRIGVILPADDDQLTSLNGFDAIRSDLESESEDAALADFFVRDASSETAFIDDSGFRQSVVRYYDITVQSQEWVLVTSLFAPRGPIRTMLSYMPNDALYSFDTETAKRELLAHGVARREVSSVIDMLARAGQVVLPASDRGAGEFDIFEIDVRDGAFRTRQLTLPDRAEKQIVEASEADSQPRRPSRSVFGRRLGLRPIPPADQNEPESSLQTVLDQLREKLAKNENVSADDVRPYLVGGAQYALWQDAEAGTRMEFAELLEKDAAASLVQELGETMLNDPDFDVRLALLASLVLSADKEAIKPIDQRLEAIEDDDTLDRKEADLEEKELRQARSALSGPKGKSPWDR